MPAAVTSAPPREEELVAGAQTGNPYAFEALFRRYRPPITGYVRARVRDEGRTEDIVQEIFFSAHNRLATLSDARAFRSWLYQIAHNACLDEARRRRRTDALILGWDEFPPPDERIVTHNPSPEHQLSQKEELADVTEAIDGLPRAQHDALVMRELEGRSYEEIGRRMSLSPAAVESVLFRARRGVKRAYAKVAAFLPLPAFLGRRGGSGAQSSSAGSFGAQAQGAAAQLSAVGGDHAVSLVHKAAAVVAAVAVVGGGTAAVQQSGVFDSSVTKKAQAKPGVVADPAPSHDRAAARDNSAPSGSADEAKVAFGGGGSSPAAAVPISNAPSSVVGDPRAPSGTDPAATAPGSSSPAGPGAPPSSGSDTPQSNQVPASTQGAESPAKKPPTKQKPAESQPLTTPTGEPIPPQLPPGIQRQLESGKRTLDELPPGQQKKLGN